VSTALRVASSHADSGARSSHDLQALIEGGLVDFEALHTGTHLDSFAAVVLIRPVAEFNVLEMMHPKTQRTRSGAFAIEVVASVAYVCVSTILDVRKRASVRITKRMLLSLANLIPAVTSEGPSTLIE
jgi:predicted RNase H-like nuclease